MALLLGVNIDHIATLRQARYTHNPEAHNAEPSPLEAARDALAGGADGLTCHLRGDRRHFQDADALRIREQVPLPVNFEMAVTGEMLGFALRLAPHSACLVPERPEEVTTEGGLDVAGHFDSTRAAVERLAAAGILVSLFIDPEPHQVEAAARSGAPMVELHTGCFAAARPGTRDAEVARLVKAAELAHRAGLRVNAGHGINYTNLRELFAVPHLTELNIGHSIIAMALRCGLTEAVRRMKELMAGYPEQPA